MRGKDPGLQPLRPCARALATRVDLQWRGCGWGDPLAERARRSVGLVVQEKARSGVRRWEAAVTGEPQGVSLLLGWGEVAPEGAAELRLERGKRCARTGLSTEARDRARSRETKGLVALRSAAATAPSVTDWRRSLRVDTAGDRVRAWGGGPEIGTGTRKSMHWNSGLASAMRSKAISRLTKADQGGP